MRNLKRGLAAFLAAALMVPVQPVLAIEKLPGAADGTTISIAEPKDEKAEAPKKEVSSGNVLNDVKTETPSNADKDEGAQTPGADQPGEGGSQIPGTNQPAEDPNQIPVQGADSVKPKKQEQVSFNTGSHKYTVVGYEDFWDNGLGDDCFEEDGSYTIHIPEENPFFPYEVQFTAKGKVTEEWFMTPDDSVEIAGHTFYVDAYFDDTVVTQMSLEVAGDIVTVYPEKKKFTDGDGVMPLSLLPLEEVKFTVDLTGYTPVELTQVSVSQIFTGDYQLAEGDKVMWCPLYSGNKDYVISAVGDQIDLSCQTSSGGTTWEMVVGEDDQLNGSNIRYLVDVQTTESQRWLVPSVYSQDSKGNRTEAKILDYDYYDYYSRYLESRELQITLAGGQMEDRQMFLGLEINPELFPETNYDEIRVFQGDFDTVEDAEAGTEVTEQLFNADLTVKDGGYSVEEYMNDPLTFVTYLSGKSTGLLVLEPYMWEASTSMSTSLYVETETGKDYVAYNTSSRTVDGLTTRTIGLDPGYAANGQYNLVFTYRKDDAESNESITAAYLGDFKTMAAAKAAKAQDIKATLFDSEAGHKADYSKGVNFSIFVGEDGTEGQEVYRYRIITEETAVSLSGDTLVRFYGLRDKDGNYVYCHVVDDEEDSYSEYNFLTILVDETADLTSLAPEFSINKGLNLYAAGSNSPEISGVSVHDFSKGAVQYSASAENKEDSKNYWLRILQAKSEEGKLYINSLADQDAKTKVENGVVYSTREAFLDGMHDYVHDILVINEGKTALSNLTVEFSSEALELDEYWTFNGKHELSGFTTIEDSTSYGELPNMAKIRLRAKEGSEGQDATGTLTIKDGAKTLMVLTLTGTVGDPTIITKDIPKAVKYVPYGTMIQNSNKYSWNKVSYRKTSGKLPAGMEVKPNGEIYGVPRETGEFTFTVRMDNEGRGYRFPASIKTFTLTVMENTNTNVDNATDEGYMVTQRIPNISLKDTKDYTFVSEGVYGEFVDIFLDGQKLTEGTDYDSESGSTRITIRSQTLKASNQTGTHTLGVEFRTGETKTLKRAAQNYEVTKSSSGGSGSGSSGGSSGGGGGSSSRPTTTAPVDPQIAKKGHMDISRGIITGEGTGYSSWQKDETGWKLRYADGTYAAGHMAKRSDESTVEQVLWEKINGSWYAFGVDQHLKSGWVFDYSDSKWYSVSVDSGMRTGWYQDTQDGYTYYLRPETGYLAVGWRQVDGKWYYFTEVSPTPTWNFDERTGSWVYNILSDHQPYGSLYKGKVTPDGYRVNEDGAWDENAR